MENIRKYIWLKHLFKDEYQIIRYICIFTSPFFHECLFRGSYENHISSSALWQYLVSVCINMSRMSALFIIWALEKLFMYIFINGQYICSFWTIKLRAKCYLTIIITWDKKIIMWATNDALMWAELLHSGIFFSLTLETIVIYFDIF